MTKKTFNSLLWVLPIVASLTQGCETVVRENIISSIDTGIGATLAENKQTQLYEFKAGYIRSQFYSVPTGKVIESGTSSDKNKPAAPYICNAANLSPQVVSGIKSSTGLQDLVLGMNISENFAVGDTGVTSPAAVAMYIANAKDAATADAAQKGVGHMKSGLTLLKPDATYAPIEAMDGVLAYLSSLPDGTNYPDKKKIITGIDDVQSLVPTWDFDSYGWVTSGKQVDITTANSANTNPKIANLKGYARFKTYWGDLKSSVQTLSELRTVLVLNMPISITTNGLPNPVPAPAAIAQATKDQIAAKLKEQQTKMNKLVKDFENDPGIAAALKYFATIVQN